MGQDDFKRGDKTPQPLARRNLSQVQAEFLMQKQLDHSLREELNEFEAGYKRWRNAELVGAVVGVFSLFL